jgi:hypothetical protein
MLKFRSSTTFQPRVDLISVTAFPFQNRLKLSSDVNVRLCIRSM